MEEVFLSKNAEETKRFAEEFAQKLKGEHVVLLYGNLGAGKTTFVQGLAKGLGIQKRIISPTFIILRSYDLQRKTKNVKFKTLYHTDLYRLQSEKEVEALGLVEIMENPDGIIVIEWPERLGLLMSKSGWKISFETTGENERKITAKKS